MRGDDLVMLSVLQRSNVEMNCQSGLVICREQGRRQDAGFVGLVLMSECGWVAV